MERRAATVARIQRVRRPAPKKPRRPPSPRSDGKIHPKGVLIGYARVSTLDQNLALQRDALTEAGCTKLFVEQVSGAVLDRPALRDALEFLAAKFLEATRLDPNDPWIWIDLGDLWVIRGSLTEAGKAFRAATEAAGRCGDERDLSVSHNKIGDVQQAQGGPGGGADELTGPRSQAVD